jgi:hypothetical protein
MNSKLLAGIGGALVAGAVVLGVVTSSGGGSGGGDGGLPVDAGFATVLNLSAPVAFTVSGQHLGPASLASQSKDPTFTADFLAVAPDGGTVRVIAHPNPDGGLVIEGLGAHLFGQLPDGGWALQAAGP